MQEKCPADSREAMLGQSSLRVPSIQPIEIVWFVEHKASGRNGNPWRTSEATLRYSVTENDV